MTDHENIPYYNNNIIENNKAAVVILTRLLEKYGQTKDSYVTVKATGERLPVLVDMVTWYDYNAFTQYTIEQFHDEYSFAYGNHFMFTNIETIDGEKEIYVIVYDTGINDDGGNVVRQSKTILKRTWQHQEEYDAWWVKNRVKMNGTWVVIYPDTTDDIAHETARILGTLEKGEKILGR